MVDKSTHTKSIEYIGYIVNIYLENIGYFLKKFSILLNACIVKSPKIWKLSLIFSLLKADI
jgi:hypothetical protein